VSLYFYLQHDPHGWSVEPKLGFDVPLKDFIKSNRVRQEIASHISYLNDVAHEFVLHVRYEDMVEDIYAVTKVVARFIGYPESDDDVIKLLVDDNSFKTVTGGRGEGNEDPTSFYRKGIVGDYKNYLNVDDLAYIWQIVQEEGGTTSVYHNMDPF
jgi:hypothetical protein